MDLCHLKNSELEPQLPNVQRQGRTPRWRCKRWFWFACSVHWTRIISISNDCRKSHGNYIKASRTFRTSSWCSIRFCSGQNGRCINVIFKFPKLECPDIWIRLPRHKWPKSWFSMEDPVVLLERNFFGHPLAGLLWERQFEKVVLEHGWDKVLNWECLFLNRAKGLFLSVYVDDIKLAGKTENIEPTWEILMKDDCLGEPSSFRDHVYLGCTQRECQISNDIVANCRDMFESRISAGAKEKLPTRASGKPYAETISSWSFDMEGHAKKCVERYCELADKTTQKK